jgi:hypothetical protein
MKLLEWRDSRRGWGIGRWTVVVLLAAIVAIMVVNLAIIRSWGATINTGGEVTRHWCRHHKRVCRDSLATLHYHHLMIDGHRARTGVNLPASNVFRAPTESTLGEWCEKHKIRRQFGGHFTNGDGAITGWVQHLNVLWCYKNGHITRDHYAHGWVDDIFVFAINHVSDTHISKWYCWRDRCPVHGHNGRFEGIDSTMQECVFLWGIGCVAEYSPWIHIHEHSDGSYTLNSGKVK